VKKGRKAHYCSIDGGSIYKTYRVSPKRGREPAGQRYKRKSSKKPQSQGGMKRKNYLSGVGKKGSPRALAVVSADFKSTEGHCHRERKKVFEAENWRTERSGEEGKRGIRERERGGGIERKKEGEKNAMTHLFEVRGITITTMEKFNDNFASGKIKEKDRNNGSWITTTKGVEIKVFN